MGGKFFDSSYRESSVKTKAKRQGGMDEPRRNKSKRKKEKKYKLYFLCEEWHWRILRNNYDGCWNLFPCAELTEGYFWEKQGKYARVRDAQNALAGVKLNHWHDWVAWKITDMDGNTIEGGLKNG